ncbi:glycosyltransferase [Leptospira levettii]|uniref:glycosyltransferase family 4 protein n=1 Tax=Leptospira levettii TaxID=2023178 RepID=UPI0010834E70|nr:glycosyltransferase family 4 protein [Leptospira levettii]TGM35462.1 glycosyltransferase [Leptospira levettii]TGM65600.1 glycosyltransferase [Leptospira levettii]TGM78935.1 glycosyltransferase [Leptospira levettii]
MKILFIAPLPPPINGHSLVCQVLYDGLKTQNSMAVVDLKKQGLKDGKVSWNRLNEIFRVFVETWKKKKNSGVVYLTISESLAGNLKDLLLYVICYSLLPKFYIHLHGGSIKKLLFDRFSLLFAINRFFIKKMGGVIISGKSHLEIFEGYVKSEKIHIIPNFAPGYMFISESDFEGKFKNLPKKINILFLSNMIPQKGYLLLLEAFQKLEKETKVKFKLNFAGRFDSKEDEDFFLHSIKDEPEIEYHGVVSDDKKRELFQSAHVFILPTMFFEGQPVSILEGYAAGCVVLTTGQSGILDVFENNKNGFEMKPGSIESIVENLKLIQESQNFDKLKQIATYNLGNAKNVYKEEIYIQKIKNVLSVN